MEFNTDNLIKFGKVYQNQITNFSVLCFSTCFTSYFFIRRLKPGFFLGAGLYVGYNHLYISEGVKEKVQSFTK